MTEQQANNNNYNPFVTITIVIMSLVMALNLLPNLVAALVTFIGLGLLLATKQINPPSAIAALVLFGEPFFHLFKGALGLRIAFIFILLTIVIIFVILRYKRNPESYFNQPAVPIFLAGMAFLYVLIIHGPLLGKMTDRNIFFMQLFVIYCTYYTAAGIMVSRSRVELKDLLIPALLLYCCVFPLINVPIYQIAHSSGNERFGLRSVETFGTIGNARQSGLLLVLIFYVFMTTDNKWRIFLPTLFAAGLAAPVLWFSFTRQAMITVFILVLLTGIMTVFRKDIARGFMKKSFAVIVTVVVLGSAIGWVAWSTKNEKQARVSAKNILGGENMAGRPEVWERSWHYIQRRPISGYGLGGYFELGLGEWPHNWFLEVWLEHGIIGLSLFILGTFLLLRPFFIKSNPWLISWSLLGLYWLIVIQFSSNIPQNSLIFFFITTATVTSASYLTVSDRKEIRRRRLQKMKAEKQPA